MLSFQWHITDRCHGRCSHCYGSVFEDTLGVNPDSIKNSLDILGSFNGEGLFPDLTGGEPLMTDNFDQILKTVENHPAVLSFGIITSGIGVTESTGRLLNRMERLAHVKISLESSKSGLNDSIRWPGSFKTACAAVRCLGSWGIGCTVMTTLCRENMHDIEDTVKLASELGAAGIILERFIPLGRGAGSHLTPLRPADWDRCLVSILRAAGIDESPESLYPYRALWIKMDPFSGEVESLDGAFCNLGADSMALMPNGDVYPCRRFPVKAGNIHKDPPQKILAALEEWSAPVIRKKLLPSVCSVCRFEQCPGCRAAAMAMSGNMYGPDPMCPLAGPVNILAIDNTGTSGDDIVSADSNPVRGKDGLIP